MQRARRVEQRERPLRWVGGRGWRRGKKKKKIPLVDNAPLGDPLPRPAPVLTEAHLLTETPPSPPSYMLGAEETGEGGDLGICVHAALLAMHGLCVSRARRAEVAVGHDRNGGRRQQGVVARGGRASHMR